MGVLDQLTSLTVGELPGASQRPSTRRPGLTDPVVPGDKGADRFAPTYVLVVNGTTLTEDVTKYITSVEYEDDEDKFDKLTIRLEGFFDDPKTGRTIPIPEWVLGSTLFSEGNIVWVYMGYGAWTNLIGGAEIVKREFDYQGNPSATIVAYEPVHRMANEFAEKSITYFGLRSSEIVKKIGKKSVYSGAIGGLFDVSNIDFLPIFTPRAEVQKKGESDWAFLRRMADIRGWHLFTRFDDKKKKFALYYGPDVDKQSGIFRYEYKNSEILPEDAIIGFTPKIDLIDQNTELEVVAFDEKRKKKVEAEAAYVPYADGLTQPNRKFSGANTDFKESELKNPAGYRLKIFGLSRRIIANRPFKDESEVKKFALQWARATIKNFITGSGTIVGNEYLQSRHVVYLMGLGETFSGTSPKPAKWYLTKVKHAISGTGEMVYQTTFDARKVIDWIPNDDIKAQLPSVVTNKPTAPYVNVEGLFP